MYIVSIMLCQVNAGPGEQIPIALRHLRPVGSVNRVYDVDEMRSFVGVFIAEEDGALDVGAESGEVDVFPDQAEQIRRGLIVRIHPGFRPVDGDL